MTAVMKAATMRATRSGNRQHFIIYATIAIDLATCCSRPMTIYHCDVMCFDKRSFLRGCSVYLFAFCFFVFF